MSLAKTLALAAIPALLAATGAVAAGPVPLAGHISWAHPDQVWLTAAGTLDANGDGIEDVVVAGGDRAASYVQCTTGGPFPLVNTGKDLLLAPSAKMSVLDGVDGEPLWEVVWGEGGPPGGAAERERWHLLQSVHTGDLDGDGAEDLLVLRVTREADGGDQTHRMTMYDPRTGATEWELVRTTADESQVSTALVPVEVFGEAGALLSEREIRIAVVDGEADITFDVESRLVRMVPDAPPETILQLPTDMAFAYPVPHGDGIRFVSFDVRIHGVPPAIEHVVDVRAVDLTIGVGGAPMFQTAWDRPGAGGAPAQITSGSAPSIVVGREDPSGVGSVAAMNLEDGTDRWVHPADVGPQGGTLIATDVDGDGIEDVVASPKFGPDPTGLFTGGFFAELVAIDGSGGQDLWRTVDPGGKFRAFSLDLADVDGDGRDEIVAGMTHPDGFPLCSSPADDPGMVGVFDVGTGATECRFSTDRFPSAVTSGNLDGTPGEEVVAATSGGTTWAFTAADPGCGLLASGP